VSLHSPPYSSVVITVNITIMWSSFRALQSLQASASDRRHVWVRHPVPCAHVSLCCCQNTGRPAGRRTPGSRYSTPQA
jgi:hypothetical protein